MHDIGSENAKIYGNTNLILLGTIGLSLLIGGVSTYWLSRWRSQSNLPRPWLAAT
jgi:hypothetical protein